MYSEILVAGLLIGGLGGALGLGLSIASKVFHVKVDEKVKEVREALPGANCGACGYVGCDAYAEAVASGEAKVNLCTVGGDPVSCELAKIMDVDAEAVEPVAARVLCNGHCGITKEKYDYSGINDCFSASTLFGGHKSCTYGCLGHGNCVRACPYGAITMVGGIAKVMEEKCRACGLCLAACPKKLIELTPKEKKYSVMCRSQDKGAITKKNCEVGCIGCRLCLKACAYGAITVENNLAYIDPQKCTNCGACVKVCPTNAIRKL
jgi:Na+-translocating ferredoxin:NAD+ oxidoreductase subunit B